MREKLTKSDIEKIQQEIEYRKLVVRKEALEAVKEARAHGDLSENFEYHAARRELGKNNGRIRYLQSMIDTAKIIDIDMTDGVVGLFDSIKLYVEEDEEEMDIVLVTTLRQDSLRGYISKESPLGMAIMGKKVGDRVSVKVNESYSYYVKILEVKKGEDDESLKISEY